MWTVINQIFTTNESKNSWAHLAYDNAWHKVAPNTADGVTNVNLVLAIAKASGKQVRVEMNNTKQITQVYL